MINLKKIEKKVDGILAGETPESLRLFLNKHRNKMAKKKTKVVITTPQFEREYDLENPIRPKNAQEIKAIAEHFTKEELAQCGIRAFATHKEEKFLQEDEVLFLFPGEWYDHIPNGYEIIDINGEKEEFVKGETDNDIRFGCLAYGFVRKEPKTEQPEAGSQKKK